MIKFGMDELNRLLPGFHWNHDHSKLESSFFEFSFGIMFYFRLDGIRRFNVEISPQYFFTRKKTSFHVIRSYDTSAFVCAGRHYFFLDVCLCRAHGDLS